jgi:hypothetical protein
MKEGEKIQKGERKWRKDRERNRKEEEKSKREEKERSYTVMKIGKGKKGRKEQGGKKEG